MIRFDIPRFQPQAWTFLARSFESGRLGGAYLFYGRDGTGRWALAVALAALLNCEKPVHSKSADVPTPCGQCRHCRTIYGLNSEAFQAAVPIPPHKSFEEAIELTTDIINRKREEPFLILTSSAGTNIPISIARDIHRRLSLRASDGMIRVVLFYQMEQMKLASADALLKLIEEPPADTIIILVTRRPESLLPTIQSRSRKVRLGRIPESAIVDYLREHYEVSENKATLSARLSDGSLGRAIDMISIEDKADDSQRAVAFMLFKSLLTDPAPQTLSELTELVGGRDRGQAENLLVLWQSLTRDCSNYAVTGDESTIINIDFESEIKRLAGRFRSHQLPERITQQIKNALADLRRNVHIHGALAALALRIKTQASGYMP
ncbi:MAG: hypothetical protein AB1744_08550, partial [Candidatus Zixiibacteriota bacterium]